MGGRLKLGQILVSKGHITPEQLAAALGEQEKWGRRLGSTLVRMGFLGEETLVEVLASQLRLPVARIRGKQINAEALALMPAELAEKHRCLPLFLRDEGASQVLMVAMEDPSDLQALDDLAFQVGRKLRPVLVAPSELEDALQRHYHGSALAGATPGPPPERQAGLRPDEFDTQPELPLPTPAAPPPPEPLPDLSLSAAAPSALASLDPAFDALSDDAPGAAFELDEGGAQGASFAALDEEPAASAPEAPRARAAAPDRRAASEPRVILRALSQLLVEKGVITRDELAERLRRVAAEE